MQTIKVFINNRPVLIYYITRILLLGILMHASLTASVLFFFMPEAISDTSLIIWYLVMAAMLWAAVAAVAVTNKRQSERSKVVNSSEASFLSSR